jgi:flagellar biosynthetic protein FliS
VAISIPPGMLGHAAALYRKTRVHTASDNHLLLDVHDAAIACVLTPSNQADAGGALLRAHALVSELQATLRPEHDAALAGELSSFYDAILHRIVSAYVQDEPGPLASVAEALRELRSVWKTVSSKSPRSSA